MNLGLHVLITCDRANVGTHECLNPYYGEVICTKTKSPNMVVPVACWYKLSPWCLDPCQKRRLTVLIEAG